MSMERKVLVDFSNEVDIAVNVAVVCYFSIKWEFLVYFKSEFDIAVNVEVVEFFSNMSMIAYWKLGQTFIIRHIP